MKNHRITIYLCLSVLLFFVFTGCSDDDADIEVIPLENVTNADFRSYLLENFDTDKDGAISVAEAEAVTVMNCPGFSGLYSLDGIEYFTNLKEFGFSNHSSDLTSLDLSKNVKLEKLDCSSSKITSLDFSNNILLKRLDCSYNNLSTLVLPETSTLSTVMCVEAFDKSLSSVSIDFTGVKSLDTLDCSNNAGIASLDMSKSVALKKLNSVGCNISELDLSQCTALKVLHCNGNEKILWANNVILDEFNVSGSNRVGSLDISNMNVRKLDCSGSSTVSVNASGNLYLKEIIADGSSLISLMAESSGLVSATLEGCRQLVVLNLKNCTQLESLQYRVSDRYGLEGGGHTDLDISGCTSLTKLHINYLNSLDATGCSSLRDLYCYGAITNLIVNGCTLLESLKLSGFAELKSLVVNDCKALKVLTCYGQFTSLDLSQNISLDSVTCYAPITEFKADAHKNLKYLRLSVDALSLLDVSKNMLLEDLSLWNLNNYTADVADCHVNASGSLSLRKADCGNARSIKSFDVEGCSNLESFFANDYLSRLDIESLNFKGCSSLKAFVLSDAPFIKSLDLSDCVSLDSVYIRSTGIQSVKFNNNVRYLDFSHSGGLSSLNMDGFQRLETLICDGNNLSNLILNESPSLKVLSCMYNELVSLDLNKCDLIKELNCYSNKLSGTLDVSNCKFLTSLTCTNNPDLTKLIVYKNHTLSSLQKDSQTILALGD